MAKRMNGFDVFTTEPKIAIRQEIVPHEDWEDDPECFVGASPSHDVVTVDRRFEAPIVIEWLRAAAKDGPENVDPRRVHNILIRGNAEEVAIFQGDHLPTQPDIEWEGKPEFDGSVVVVATHLIGTLADWIAGTVDELNERAIKLEAWAAEAQ